MPRYNHYDEAESRARVSLLFLTVLTAVIAGSANLMSKAPGPWVRRNGHFVCRRVARIAHTLITLVYFTDCRKFGTAPKRGVYTAFC